MPAEECNNGKWKWGETGECKYETQEEAEKDNEDYYENNDEYGEHHDLSTITSLTWLYKEPKDETQSQGSLF